MTEKRLQPEEFLPLSPLEFRILLALRDGCRHGYAIVKDVEARAGDRKTIYPANLYRRIRNLLAAGLIAEAAAPKGSEPDDDRHRKYFRLTPLGLDVAQAEAERLEDLLSEAREAQLLPGATSGSTR
jgi:DNA-binding PadR family transcriptional regulator